MNPGEGLVEYGIQTEQSDVRIHVCPVARLLYVYPTSDGNAAILSGRFRRVPGYQDGQHTAEGYLVPPSQIEGCERIPIPADLLARVSFSRDDDLSAKGQKAIKIVWEMFRRRLIFVSGVPEIVTSPIRQRNGQDLVLFVAMQVKCDYSGGDDSRGGTGYLFLQVAERNPMGRH